MSLDALQDLQALLAKHNAQMLGNAQTYYPSFGLYVDGQPVFAIVAEAGEVRIWQDPPENAYEPYWPPDPWEDVKYQGEP